MSGLLGVLENMEEEEEICKVHCARRAGLSCDSFRTIVPMGIIVGNCFYSSC